MKTLCRQEPAYVVPILNVFRIQFNLPVSCCKLTRYSLGSLFWTWHFSFSLTSAKEISELLTPMAYAQLPTRFSRCLGLAVRRVESGRQGVAVSLSDQL
jgi:hypothetical protein